MPAPVDTDAAPDELGATPMLNVKDFGAKGDGVTDDYAAIQAAITASGTTGGTVFFPAGTYYLNRAGGGGLKLPPSNTSWLVFYGYGATVKLSSNVPRFLDFARTADYQSFQYFDVRGFVVDCDDVSLPAGLYHRVLGSLQTNGARMNIRHIRVRDVSAINIPGGASEPGRHVGISFRTKHYSENESTTTHVDDIRIENYHQEGGDHGVIGETLVDNEGDGYPLSVNIEMTGIYLDGIDIDTGQTASSAKSSTSLVQFGGGGHGGTFTMLNSSLSGSGDNCTEIDSFDRTTFSNVRASEARYLGFLIKNVGYPIGFVEGVDEMTDVNQQNTFTGCSYTQGSGTAVGFGTQLWVGSVSYEDCHVYDYRTNAGASSGWFLGSNQEYNKGRFNSISLKDCSYTRSGAVANDTVNRHSQPINVVTVGSFDLGKTPVTLEGVSVYVRITYIGSVLYDVRPFSFYGRLDLAMRGCSTNVVSTSSGLSNTTHVTVGNPFVAEWAQSMSGVIDGCTFASSGSASVTGAKVYGTDDLTIDPSITIQGCDFTGLETSTNVFNIDASQSGKVILRDNTW